MMLSILSREQERSIKFQEMTEPLRQFVGKLQEPSFVSAIDQIRDAVSSFGKCELLMRQADRWTTGGINKNSSQDYSGRALRYQELGLFELTRVRETIEGFSDANRKRLVNVVIPDSLTEELSRVRSDFVAEICDLEIKAGDVQKITDAFDRGMSVLLEGDWDKALDLCRSSLSELEEARRSEDRGVRDNLQWWKRAAIIAFVAIVFAAVLVAVIMCIVAPPCLAALIATGTASLAIGTGAAVYFISSGIAAFIAGLVVLFC